MHWWHREGNFAEESQCVYKALASDSRVPRVLGYLSQVGHLAQVGYLSDDWRKVGGPASSWPKKTLFQILSSSTPNFCAQCQC
eukprot:2641572-Rhodomonas_salina.1